MLRVLLDTNQLVSSLLSTRGPQRQLIDAWRRRAFLLFVTAEQLEEMPEVLGRPKILRKYPISPADRQALVVHPAGIQTGVRVLHGVVRLANILVCIFWRRDLHRRMPN